MCNFRFTKSNGYCQVDGYEGNGRRLIIPAVFDNLPVTKLGEGAFKNSAAFGEVFIPASVT